MASAGSTVSVNLNFTASTKQAKAEIDKLQESLRKIAVSENKSGDLGILKEIKQADAAAISLQAHLRNAIDPKSGKLDLSRLNQSFKEANVSLETFRKALATAGPAGKEAFNGLAKSILQADVPLRQTNKLIKEFGVTLKNTVKWQLSSGIVHGLVGSIQSAYGYAQDLNKSLSNIRIVTGQSADEMANFAKQANESAKALSVSTTAYTDAALIFYQQGLGDKEVKERTDAVIKMSNITGDSVEDVSNYMTAIWNNFDDGSKSLEHYADVITALGAATASSSAEIANGLERFASIGETVGLSYDYATSALATVVATTRQSEEIVGTAFKTIFARMQGLQQGETLEDGTNLNKYSQALENVGVQIKDENDHLRDMDLILDDLGAKWETLSRDQQNALAQTVAGTRQYTQLLALMNNWDFFKENVETARNSEGALQEQADIYAESWEAANKRLRASFQGLWDTVISDDFFIGIINGTSKTIDLIDKLIDSLGGLPGLLGTIGGLATKLYSKDISNGINKFITNLTTDPNAIAKSMKEEVMRQQSAFEDTDKEMIKNQNLDTLHSAYYNNFDNLSEVQRLQVQFAMEMFQTRQELLEKDEEILEKRREQLEIDQEDLQVQQQKVNKLNDEASKAEQRLNDKKIDLEAARTVSNRNVDNLKKRLTTRFGSEGSQSLKDQISSYRELYSVIKDLGNIKGLDQRSGIISFIKTLSQAQIKHFGKIFGEDFKKDLLDIQTNGTKANQAIKNLQQTLNGNKSLNDQAIEKIIEKFKNLAEESKKGKMTTEDFQKSFESLVGDMEIVAQQLDITRQATENYTKAAEAAAEANENFENSSQAREEAEQDLKDREQKVEDERKQLGDDVADFADTVNEAGGNSGEGKLNIGDTITGLVESLGSLVSVGSAIINIMNTIGDVFNNGEVSAESLLAVVASLTTGLAGASFAVEGVTLALTGLGVEAAAAAAAAGPIVAIIAGIIGVSYLLYNAWKKFHTLSPEEEFAKATAAAKQAEEAYEAVANKFNDVTNSLSEYSSAKDALSELTIGTEEWANAVSNLNDNIMSLIDKYPQLAEGLEITNGVITVNEETMKNFIEELRQQKALANINKASSKQDAYDKQQVVDRQSAYETFSKRDSIANEYKTTYALNALLGTYIKNTEEIGKVDIGTFIKEAEFEQLIDAVKKEGEDILEDSQYLQKQIGLTATAAESIAKDEKLRGDIQKQVSDEEAKQKTLSAQITAAMAGYLSVSGNKNYEKLLERDTERSENISELVSHSVTSHTGEDSAAYKKAYDNLTDNKEVAKRYIQATTDLVEGTEEYSKAVESLKGDELENAKKYIAQADATQTYIQENLDNVIDKFSKANINNDLSSFLTGDEVDIKNLSPVYKEAIRNMKDSSDFEQLFKMSESDLEEFEYYGEDAAEKFIEHCNEVLDHAELDFDGFKEKFKQGGDDLSSTFADITNKAAELEPLKDIYDKIANGKGVDWNKISSTATGGFQDTFSKYTKEYQKLMKVLNESPKDLNKQQKAWNELVGAWIKGQKEFTNATKKTADAAKGALKDMGVKNADEIIDEFVKMNSAVEETAEGLSKLRKEYNDYINIAEKVSNGGQIENNAELKQYNDYIQLVKQGLQEISGYNFSDEIIQQFVASEANAELFARAIHGDVEAIQTLKVYAEAIKVSPELNDKDFRANLQGLIDLVANTDIDIDGTAALDNSPMLAALQEAVIKAGGSAKDIERILSSIPGIKAKIKYDVIELPSLSAMDKLVAKSKALKTGGIIKKDKVKIPVSIDWEKTGSGASTVPDITPNYGGSGGGGGGKGGGGGGGGKGKEPKEPKEVEAKHEDPIKEKVGRYKELEAAIDKVERSMSRLEKLQDHLHGKELINSLKTENKMLEKQKKNYEALNAELTKHNKNINKKLQKQGYETIQEDDGYITNYREVFNSIKKRYNEAVKAFNKSQKEYKKQAEKFDDGEKQEEFIKDNEKRLKKEEKQIAKEKKKYEKAKKRLEKYEDNLQKIKDNADKIEDMLYQQIENNLKRFETKVKISLDLKQATRDVNNFINSTSKNFQAKFKSAAETMADLNTKLANAHTYTDPGGTIETRLNQIKKVQDIIQDDSYDYHSKNSLFASRSEAIEKLKEYQDELIKEGTDLHQLWQDSYEIYMDYMDSVGEDWDRRLDDLEEIMDQFDHLSKLNELLYGENSAQGLANQKSIAQKELKTSLETQKALRKEIDTWEKEYNEMIKNGADKNSQDMIKIKDRIKDANKKLTTEIENYLETAIKKYETSIKQIMTTADKNINKVGKKSYSTELLKERYDLEQAAKEGYYDEVERVYQIERIENLYNQAIKGTDSIKNQQYLNKLKEKALASLKAEVDLSEYDVTLEEKRLEAYKAYVELKDSQDQKNAMKLTRNDAGDWTYQYVADDTDVLAKTQDWLDKQYEAYEYVVQSQAEAIERLLTLQLEAEEQLSAIAEEMRTADSTRRAELQEQYEYLLGYYWGDDGIITKTARETNDMERDLSEETVKTLQAEYEANSSSYEIMTDKQKDLIDELKHKGIDDYRELTHQIATDPNSFYKSMGAAIKEVVKENTGDWERQIKAIIEKWVTNPDSVMKQMQLAYKNIQTAVSDYDKDIEKSEQASGTAWSKIKEGIDAANKSLEDLNLNLDELIGKTGQLSEQKAVVDEIGKAWESVKDAIYAALQANLEYLKLQGEDNSEDEKEGKNKNKDKTFSVSVEDGDGDAWIGDVTAKNKKQAEQKAIKEQQKAFGNKTHSAGGGYTVISSKKKTGQGKVKMATGGYTGDWSGNEGKEAILHKKELVLNQEDTKNILAATAVVRSISNLLSGIGLSTAALHSTLNPNPIVNNTNTDSKIFNITAQFPNANSVTAIQEAILNLPNLASQYINANK